MVEWLFIKSIWQKSLTSVRRGPIFYRDWNESMKHFYYCIAAQYKFFSPSGGMDKIQLHTFGLTRYTYMLLSSLCHGNGQPVAQIYSHSEFENPNTQGAILNFNLMDCHGQMIGYSQVHSNELILFTTPSSFFLHLFISHIHTEVNSELTKPKCVMNAINFSVLHFCWLI